MNRSIITGLVLAGLMASAGAFAQSPQQWREMDNKRQEMSEQTRQERMDRERRQAEYNRRSNYSGRYQNTPNTGTRYDSNYDRTRDSRYDDRYDRTSSANNRNYDYQRDTDNDQYIYNYYQDGNYMNRGYGDGSYYGDRYNYGHMDYRTYPDKRAKREMRRAERNRRYGSRYTNTAYSTSRYYNDNYNYRDSRYYDRQDQREMRRSNRNRYDNTRYDYPVNSRNYYRSSSYRVAPYNDPYENTAPYRNSRYENSRDYNGTVNYMGRTSYDRYRMPEGLMDYDTWMRYRNNDSRMTDEQRLDRIRTNPEYQRQEQRRVSQQSRMW